MQGLADGYFVIPYTIGTFLSNEIRTPNIDANHEAFGEAEKEVEDRINQLMSINGNQSPETFHRRLGKIMWEYCGMSRNADGLQKARKMVQDLREEFYSDLYVPGDKNDYNPELEKAYRVADFLELGEVMILDALNREESCGGHFREEYQTEEGEALRRDEEFAYVAAWGWEDTKQEPELHKEELVFENVELKTRSYK
jgi:succinate dehydrogenase / fumarate reductase flavoprotein subunit